MTQLIMALGLYMWYLHNAKHQHIYQLTMVTYLVLYIAKFLVGSVLPDRVALLHFLTKLLTSPETTKMSVYVKNVIF